MCQFGTFFINAFLSLLQVLYEIAFVFGCFETSFSLYTSLPRTRVSEDISVGEVLSLSQVLSAEIEQEPIDIQLFLTEEMMSDTKVLCVHAWCALFCEGHVLYLLVTPLFLGSGTIQRCWPEYTIERGGF